MREERLEVSVTFDGYVASEPELRTAVVALSLGGLRRKIEARCCCPPRSRSCCSSTASPSGNVTGGRCRRS